MRAGCWVLVYWGLWGVCWAPSLGFGPLSLSWLHEMCHPRVKKWIILKISKSQKHIFLQNLENFKNPKNLEYLKMCKFYIFFRIIFVNIYFLYSIFQIFPNVRFRFHILTFRFSYFVSNSYIFLIVKCFCNI